MGPIVKQLASDNADKSIQFVTFDFTSDETKAAAQAKAEELGVAGTYAANAPKTGFALIYDTKKQAIVTKLGASDDTTKWQEAINGVLGG